MSNPVGRPSDEIADAWRLRFGLTDKQHANLRDAFLAQLSYCKSDEARRIILGISEVEDET